MKQLLRGLLLTMLLQVAWGQGYRTMGLDLEILAYGGSLGGFMSYHPKPALSLDLETDWALVESDETLTYYNYYGQPVSINDRNLSFAKFLAGTTWYPFLDQMDESLEIGFHGALGPLVALNTDDDETLVVRWRDVETDVILSARVGLQARIRNAANGAYVFRLGYDVVRFPTEIDGRDRYDGLFFQAAWEFVHR